MKNAIYSGDLIHRRFKPKFHQFKYRVNYFYFNLNSTEELITIPFLISYNPINYLNTKQIINEINNKYGANDNNIHSIYILTQLSYFGFCFNPVSFYYCFDKNNELLYIVSLITNTPWGEKHIDCFDFKTNKGSFSFPKNFHVSPFMPMTIDYDWKFSIPDEKINIIMKNYNKNENASFFIATLNLNQKELNLKNVLLSSVLFPLMSFKTIFAIYWQAFILYLKGIPFYIHPKKGGVT